MREVLVIAVLFAASRGAVAAECPAIRDVTGLQVAGFSNGKASDLHAQVYLRVRYPIGRSAIIAGGNYDLWAHQAAEVEAALSRWLAAPTAGVLWSGVRYQGLAQDTAAPVSGAPGPWFPMVGLELRGDSGGVTLLMSNASNNARNAGDHAVGRVDVEFRLSPGEVSVLAGQLRSWTRSLDCRPLAAFAE